MASPRTCSSFEGLSTRRRFRYHHVTASRSPSKMGKKTDGDLTTRHNDYFSSFVLKSVSIVSDVRFSDASSVTRVPEKRPGVCWVSSLVVNHCKCRWRVQARKQRKTFYDSVDHDGDHCRTLSFITVSGYVLNLSLFSYFCNNIFTVYGPPLGCCTS